MTERLDDAKMIRGLRRWPGETLCVKKYARGDEPKGVMGYSAFGVMTQPAKDGRQIVVYLREDFVRTMTYQTVEDMLEAGWVVD